MTDTNLLSGELGNIVNFIAASGGLGTAAMGVVDASKGIAGGPSRVGFSEIKSALRPFLDATRAAAGTGAPGRAVDDMIQTLRANWMNGVPLTDQKAKAKALIHLGLTAQSAPALAGLAGVDAAKLSDLAKNVANGTAPAPDELNVLGQFDVVLAAVLDAAFERACTAPGFLDNRLCYAARLRLCSRQAERVSSGLRWPFFSISHAAL
jgi:hypothetical protein